MSGASPSRLIRDNALVVGLCLLAVLFAVEAKLAWYSPMHGPGSDVRSAKAFRPDTPKVVDRGNSSSSSDWHLITFALLATFATAFAAPMSLMVGRHRERNPQQASLAAFSVTNLFLRPPPVI